MSWVKIGSAINGYENSKNLGHKVTGFVDGSFVAFGAYLNDVNGNLIGYVSFFKDKSSSWSQK